MRHNETKAQNYKPMYDSITEFGTYLKSATGIECGLQIPLNVGEVTAKGERIHGRDIISGIYFIARHLNNLTKFLMRDFKLKLDLVANICCIALSIIN